MLFNFATNSVFFSVVSPGYAQTLTPLPAPGTMVALSEGFIPPLLKGIKLYPNNPLQFDFFIDSGDIQLNAQGLKEASQTLVKYFLASLTTPEDDLWVNLSPYEQQRIIPEALSRTDMGRDLLAQDYILKQLTASLVYPEEELGRSFWKKVYDKSVKIFGHSDIPLNTFNKVWIVPTKAVIYENENTAFVVQSHLKVMLEEDYLSLTHHLDDQKLGTDQLDKKEIEKLNEVSASVLREVILPEIEKEVNEGKNFARLRQIFHSLILATWFKKSLKESLLGKVYVDQNKIRGIDLEDTAVKQKIYDQYLEAFQKGVYNYIREEFDPLMEETVPRKYFSGGIRGKFDISDLKITYDLGQVKNTDSIYQGSVRLHVADELMLGETPKRDSETESSQINETIGRIHEAVRHPRSLIFTDQVDFLDSELITLAKAKGTPFLRVTVRDQTDLDRLLTIVQIDNNGDPQPREGKLVQIIQNGGILLFDYTDSDPKLVEGFNSLFDPNPYFQSYTVSKDVRILGVMSEKKVGDFPASFYSRFSEITSIQSTFNDPLGTIRGPPDGGFSGITVDLFESPLVRETLVGRYLLDEKGKIKVIPGALIKAILENKPLLIRGGNWNDPKFTDFLRGVLMKREIESNGKTLRIPDDFKIYRMDVDFKKDIKNKKIILSEESNQEGDVWVINRENQDQLFAFTHITQDGKLTQKPGLLSHQKLRLRVTDQLANWIWHQIMHSDQEVEVQVLPGVFIPSEYSSLRSEALKKSDRPRQTQTLTQTKGQKVVFIEGDDLSFIRAQLRTLHPQEDLLIYPITGETNLDQLTSSIEIEKSTEGKKQIFKAQLKDVLDALKEGKTVVLEGIHANESLWRELETTLQEVPYLLVNGERISLNDLPGRLYLTAHPPKGISPRAQNHVVLPADDNALAEILQQEFKEIFNPDDFNKILRLRQIFETIPAPQRPGLYPTPVQFNLARLRLLYGFDNWLEAFERIFISHYLQDPEVTAFMRVMVRLTLNLDQPGLRPQTVHGRKLNHVLNKTISSLSWDKHFWEFADTLSLDVLKKVNPGTSFDKPQKTKLFSHIQQALVKQQIFKENAERENFYRQRFNLKNQDVSTAPDVDEQTTAGEQTWQERKEKVIRILKISNAVMLKGPPGTGKSFITEDIARELGYRNGEIFGPLTVGVDTQETDVVSRRLYNNQQTQIREERIAQWAKSPQGGILIVDEANLTKPAFWNFLRGLFSQDPFVWINGKKYNLTSRHKVIFTGNQDTLAGRQIQQLIEEFVMTVYFPPFDTEFIKDRLKDYIASHKADRNQLIDLIRQLHMTFEKMNGDFGFSLRDIQELSARVNVMLETQWKKEDVVQIAWNIYKGYSSPEEQLALQYIITNKFGVVLHEIEKEKIFQLKKESSSQYASGDIYLADSTAAMVDSINDFLVMRQARLQGKSLLQGKRGIITEGPSGRGKDAVLIKTLNLAGYQNAQTAEAGTPANQRYYRINASMDFDLMVATIRKAQKEGSIVIISEMNLLPSAFLEGKLNDVLTGQAHEGFALFATMNSVDFSGREKLSTALLNRVIYQRIQDYDDKDLLDIAREHLKRYPLWQGLEEKEVRKVLKAHLWIKNQIKNPQHRPTFREFLSLLISSIKTFPDKLPPDQKLLQQPSSVEENIQRIYGPVYLEKILKGASLPREEELLQYQEPSVDMTQVMEKIAGHIVPSSFGAITINLDPSDREQAGGYASLNPATGKFSVTMRARAFNSEEWINTLFHEASHGLFTRTSAIAANPLFQDLEDLRHEAAFHQQFPYSTLGLPRDNEEEFAQIVTQLDVDSLYQWTVREKDRLTLRGMFQYTLLIYAKGLVDRGHLEAIAEVIEDLFAVNPLRLALKHLDTAVQIHQSIPTTLDEEEIAFQQYRAMEFMKTILEDYLIIPDESKDIPDLSETEQELELNEAKKKLHQGNWKPTGGQAAGRQKGKASVPSTEDIARKKQALAEKRETLLKMTKTDVLKELSLMVKDIYSPYGISDDRLDEIMAQLTEVKLPFSLVHKIKQLNDPQINQWVEEIKIMVTDAKNFMKSQTEGAAPEGSFHPFDLLNDSMKSNVDSLLEKIKAGEKLSFRENLLLKMTKLRSLIRRILTGMGALAVSPGAGSLLRGGESSQEPIKKRYGMVHSQERSEKHNPVPLSPAKVKPAEVLLRARETMKRDAMMKKITENTQGELQQAIDFFIRYKLNPEKIYGHKGSLDVERFVTGDPTTAFVSSGGSLEKQQKEIVLYGDLPHSQWSPLLQELFHFLFEQGFKVTVYPSLDRYVEGISTLGDLMAIYPKRQDRPTPKEILKDLESRKSNSDYELTNLLLLQNQVEAIYAYGAFKAALQNRLSIASSLKEKELSQEEQRQKLGEEPILSFEEQLKKIEKALNELQTSMFQVARHGVLGETIQDNIINLSLAKEGRLVELGFLKGVWNLNKLDIEGTRVSDISPLFGLPLLSQLNLTGTEVTQEQIYELYRNHPTGYLNVINAQGDRFFWGNVPEKFHPRPLSFAEQVTYARFLFETSSIPEAGHLMVDYEKNQIMIDFESFGKAIYMSLLTPLKDLTHLNLGGVKGQIDLTNIWEFPNLKWLNLKGTDRKEFSFSDLKTIKEIYPDSELQVQMDDDTILKVEDFTQLILQEQLAKAREILTSAGKPAGDVEVSNSSPGRLYWNLSNADLEDPLPDLSEITYLNEVDLDSANIANINILEPLVKLTNLKRINLVGVSSFILTESRSFQEQIVELLKRHPNKKLIIRTSKGKSITRDDNMAGITQKDLLEDEEVFISAEEHQINYVKQMNIAIGILMGYNLPLSKLSTIKVGYLGSGERPREYLSLDLSSGVISINMTELRQLTLLNKLKSPKVILDLSGPAFESITELRHLERLEIPVKAALDSELLRRAYLFFQKHPNREGLEIIFADMTITYNDVPPEYKVETGKLGFNEQRVKAWDFLEAHGTSGEMGVSSQFTVEYETPTHFILDLKKTANIKEQDLVELLKSIPDLTGLYLPSYFNMTDYLIEGLNSLPKLKDLRILHVQTEPLTKQINRLLAVHPNRKTLEIKLRDTPFKAADSENVILFLTQLANSLVNPAETLEDLRKRFKVDGQEEAFNKISGEILNSQQLYERTKEAFEKLPSPKEDSPPVKEKDNLMLGKENKVPGGINLNPELFDLEIQGHEGKGDAFPEEFLKDNLDPRTLEHIQINGFTPVIFNIIPVTNLPLILGATDKNQPVANPEASFLINTSIN